MSDQPSFIEGKIRISLPLFIFAIIPLTLMTPETTSAADQAEAKELRLGLIGLDTSHVTAFASRLNRKDDKNHVP